MRSFQIVLLLMVLSPLTSQSQTEWTVPDNKKGKLSDFAFTDSTRQAGLQIYALNCRSCHGDPGKANFQPLNPIPGDPATDKFQHNLDGELLYKIQEGHGLMPSFKNILNPVETWNLIGYLRSFNNDYIQQIAEKIVRGDLRYSDLLIVLSRAEAHTVVAQVTGNEQGTWNPVTGADVQIFAHRYFGHLPVDEIRTTDFAGLATFTIPEDLPGDTLGRIHLLARLSDQEAFGIVETEASLEVGNSR